MFDGGVSFTPSLFFRLGRNQAHERHDSGSAAAFEKQYWGNLIQLALFQVRSRTTRSSEVHGA
jgi:hypothetical protein